MKVLLVHNAYRDRGGEERHLDLLEQGLVSIGVDTRRHVVESAAIARAGVGRRLMTAATMTYNPGAGRRIRTILGQWAPDVVHVHNLFPSLTPSVLREARRAGAATVLTAHNYRLFCPAGTLTRRGVVHSDCIKGSSLLCGVRGARSSFAESVAYGLAVELNRRLRLTLRWTDAIVAPSAALRDTLVRAGFPRGVIRHVANGVDVPTFTPRERHHVLYAGRLAREKGLETLVAAARLVSEIPVKIAGSGPLGETLRDLPANVELLGWLTPEQLAELRFRSAVEVVPSIGPDVLPYAALEALAAGTPVLASRIGGLPEIATRGAGETVEPGDPGALADAIRRWWERADEPDYGRDAWNVASTDFCLATQTERIAALYREVSR